MATPATGNGPFEFTDANGRQISVPLSAFSFDAFGNLVVAGPWQALVNTPAGSGLVQYSLNRGLIAPAAAPSPKPAALIKAASPGSGGNDITVTIQNIAPNADPTKTTFDIEVTQTDSYSKLTVSSIESVLGSDQSAGSQPGLVHVIHSSVTSNTSDIPAALSNANLGGGGTTAKATLDVKDGSNNLVFTLEARDPGADGDTIQITITPAAGTFDLTATWTKSATGVTIATLQSKVAGNLAYEIAASAPAGGVFSVPAAVTTNLSGGANGVNASATLFSSQ